MSANENVVPLHRGSLDVETRLNNIVNTLAFVRSLTAIVDRKDTELNGEQIYGIFTLLENEAIAALKSHLAS